MQPLLDAIRAPPRPTDAQRVFHGLGALHPGSEHRVLDAYPPVWVLTSFQPATDDELATIGRVLAARWAQLASDQPLHWVCQCRHDGRSETRVMAGAVPDPLWVTRMARSSA